LEIVEALLDAGADAHIKNSKGYTAVHSGAIGGFFDVVLRLVRQGALWKMRPDCDVVKMITRKSQLK
jgi:ankyrin repeat protein